MSLTNPKFQSVSNPGAIKSNQSPLLGVVARSGINQIRGTTVSGSTGDGIPNHVTNIGAKVSNAQSGSTSTLSVIFRRDPSDVSYSGVNILVKGYQGNQTPVQVASGVESPVTCVLNNTGEALSVIVQATGNGGAAPIDTAPTTGAQLPKSTSGGFSTTTVTSYSVSNPPPASTPTLNSGSGAIHSWYGHPLSAASNLATPNNAAGAPTANAINCVKVFLPFSITVSRIGAANGAAVAGSSAVFAVYDSAGTTLLLQAALGTGIGVLGRIGTTLGSPVTLSSGVYWFAHSSTTNTATLTSGFTLPAEPSTGSYTDAINETSVRVGIAANTLSGTSMPSSLGAISRYTSTSNMNHLGFILEV